MSVKGCTTCFIPSLGARKVCVIILSAAVCGIEITKEDITCTSRCCRDAGHCSIVGCNYVVLLNATAVGIKGYVVGVNIPRGIEGCCCCAIPIVNALHTFIVILRSLTVRLGEVSCESITCASRSGCRRHCSCKCCINGVCTACTVLFIKRNGYGVSNPLCVKRSVFCLIPNLYACHCAIVILNTFCIIVTVEGISCIGVRCGSFRHSRAEGCGNGVSTTVRAVSIKSYGVGVGFPLCIQGDNITLRCRKVENLVCVIIRCTCSVGVCSPANKGISNSRKEI